MNCVTKWFSVPPVGGVGQHVTEALIAAGFKVVALLRKVRALDYIAALPLTQIFT